MITISYNTPLKQGVSEIANIPEQWRDFASYRLLSAGVAQISIKIQPDDSSYIYTALMQFRQMYLKFSLPFYWEFPVGSWVTYNGITYYIIRPEDIKKQGNRNLEYSMTLYGEESALGNYKFRNSVDGRLKWSMCAQPQEFLQEICNNLNERTGTTKWKVAANCLKSTEKTVEFNHTYLSDALNDIANTFETEWEIDPVAFTVALHKVEKFRDKPLPLGFGRGNGFVPGVGRVSEQGGEPVKRLYAQGGERNIDRSYYGEHFKYSNNPAELRLPKSGTIRYDGEYFEGEDGFNALKAHTYQSDAQGYYIERIDVVSDAVKDDSLDCSEIYPSRIGEVTDVPEVSEEDKKKNFYDFVDNTINLDFAAYMIAGETMTIIFQDGMLAGDGKEFEVKYYHTSVNGRAAKRFEIVPQEIDGITMPNETFKMVKGNHYAIFGVKLPDEYICDDANKKGAAWDMMRETVRKLYECENQKFTFSGELQGKWAKRNWERIGAQIVVGGYVLFTDNQFAPNGEEIRIVGIKEFLTNPYAPTIELSNAIASTANSVNSSLQQIDNTEVVIEDTKRDILRFTKRRFRDALETIGMLEDAQLANFNSAISPVAVQTMAMLVGDESLQFLMGKTIAGIGSDDWSIGFANGALTSPSGYLRHMTIGVNTITATRESIDYLTWRMPQMNLTPKTGSKYYVYAVVNREGFSYDETNKAYICNTWGTWDMSVESHPIDEDPSKYYLLVGILNSEYQGERSFAPLYGFTEILPGQITTDVIVSNDGKTYMNLRTGEIGGNIKFLSENDEYITIIEGGKIKTELLDVSQIIARSVIVGEPGKQRVEITPNSEGNGSVKIFDSDDNEVTVLEGIAYDSINQLYDSSSGGTCEILTRTTQQYGYASGVTLGRGSASYAAPSGVSTSSPVNDTIKLSKPWHTSAPTEVVIKSGHLYAYAYAASVTSQNSGGSGLGGIVTTPSTPTEMSSASAHVIVRCETYSDEEMTNRISTVNVASATASASPQMNAGWSDVYPGVGNGSTTTYPGQSNTSGVVNIGNKKIKVPAGYHQLTLYISCSATKYNSNASVEWGFTSGTRSDITAEYKNDSYVSRFFANGFCLGTRSDNYVMVMRTANGMRFIMENNDIGFDFSNAGIRTRAKGNVWMPLPMLIYKASYYYLSTNNTYPLDTSKGYKVFNSTTMSATRTGKGLVTLTFPESWKTALGTINVQNLLVHVNAYHQVIDCRVEEITSSAIKVAMSDDASLNDGNFSIEIYYLAS